MHVGPRPLMDPVVLLESILDKGEKEAKDVCKDVARELSREQVYLAFLEKFFGFRGYADRTIDGGLLGKRKLSQDHHSRVPGLFNQDIRCMLLTSDSRYPWNLYWILFNTRDTREADVHNMMLPRRTQQYLQDMKQEFELLSTDNRKLYEQVLPNSSRTHGMLVPKIPLKLAVLDHYHFTFAYWAVIDKRTDAAPEMLTSIKYVNFGRVKYEYEKAVAEGQVTTKTIMARGVYFELVQAYMSTYFPRDLDTSNQPVDADQALRMPFESEKFLRILIEMWLERNSVTNPDQKQQARAADEENAVADFYLPPHSDAIHGTIITVAHLLARKVQVDLATQGNRGARPVHICPALEALSQPVFIFLVLAFRHLKVSSHSTEFFLAVDLWLTWLQPSLAFNKAGGGAGSQTWSEIMLKSYVSSNFHFYTTLLVLFIRKIRETLGAGWGRQELTLTLLKRVLSVYKNQEVKQAVREASKEVNSLWFHGNVPIRGLEYLLRHIRHMRLGRSRPCLLSESYHDADYLRAELSSAREQARVNMHQTQNVAVKWTKKVVRAFVSMIEGDVYSDPPAGDWDEDHSKVILKIEEVLKDMEAVFPEARQSWESRNSEGEECKDADRSGILLTSRGRGQVLSGTRPCDPRTIVAHVDPLYNKELGDYEIKFMVRFARWLYKLFTPLVDPDYVPPPPQEERKHTGGHVNMRTRMVGRPPRYNVRRYVADIRFLAILVVPLGLYGCLRMAWWLWSKGGRPLEAASTTEGPFEGLNGL